MNLEDEIMKVKDRADKSEARYCKKISLLRSKLKNCKHKYTVEYQWEHDNGYGRQTMISGLRCLTYLKKCCLPGIYQYWS